MLKCQQLYTRESTRHHNPLLQQPNCKFGTPQKDQIKEECLIYRQVDDLVMEIKWIALEQIMKTHVVKLKVNCNIPLITKIVNMMV